LKETFLGMIEHSVGSKMFQSSYFSEEGKLTDFCCRGRLSCAFYVSSILKIFDLVKTLHTTVEGLEKDLIRFGWEIKNSIVLPGDIIVWAGAQESGFHRHIGFYVDGFGYVSNNSKTGRIIRHDFFGPDRFCVRMVEKIYRYPALY